MHALNDLLSTDYGLMSVAGILFMLWMGYYFISYMKKHIKMDAEAAAQRSAQGTGKRA